MSTPRLGLSTVPSGSLQPSVPINESLQLLDALVQAGAVSALRNTPPPTTDADAGAVYIVGDTPTGAWAGHGLSIALCTAANTWYFLAPKVGYTLYVHDQGVPFVYHSTGWAPAARVATKTASTDLALSDADVLLMDSSASNVLTLQPDALVPINPGRRFTVVQKGVGATSIAAASGVTIRTAGSLTLGTQYAAGTLTKIGADEWLWTTSGSGSDGGSAPSTLVNALTIASGVVNIDLALGDYFTLVLTANVTSITFSNLPAAGQAKAIAVRIKQDATGGRTLALPASFKATGGSDTAVASAADAYTLLTAMTFDQGARWAYAMQEVAA